MAVRLSNWMPPLVLCVILFLISSHQVPEIIPSFKFSDKLNHFLAYSALAFLTARAVRSWPGWRGGRVIIFVIGFTALYGVSDEIHQYFVPTRFSEVSDAIADTLGGVFGTFVYTGCLRLFDNS